MITKFLQVVLAKHAACIRRLADSVTRRIARPQGRKQSRVLLWRGMQFYDHTDLHTFLYHTIQTKAIVWQHTKGAQGGGLGRHSRVARSLKRKAIPPRNGLRGFLALLHCDAERGVEWRIIYCIDTTAIVVLHIFEKKTQTTPERIVQVCRQRLVRYLAAKEENATGENT